MSGLLSFRSGCILILYCVCRVIWESSLSEKVEAEEPGAEVFSKQPETWATLTVSIPLCVFLLNWGKGGYIYTLF